MVYDVYKVRRLTWCANSPDFNMIELCWPWMKRRTTKKGVPKSRKEAVRVWEKAWDDLEQTQIQAWIKRIVVYIQQVIQLKGGNEYKEGRRKGRRKGRKGGIEEARE